MTLKFTIIEKGYDIAHKKEKVKVLKNGDIYLENGNLSVILFRENSFFRDKSIRYGSNGVPYPMYSNRSCEQLLVDMDPDGKHDFRKLIPR
ncbi:MAG: hypothetical protein NTY20_03465 [Candidatus Aenigmarchaeota archaeon]|nr:hypothetical protein [Candidatus Aenigmarchaeota archaeon]